MTITQFVDKWAPPSGDPKRIDFALDLKALLTDQLIGLQELLHAVEGKSLRLLDREIERRKVDSLKLYPLPMPALKSDECSCSIQTNPKTGNSLRLSMGRDLMRGGYSGAIEVRTDFGDMRERFSLPRSVSMSKLDECSRNYLWPAVEELVDRIAPIRAVLPPMRADFSYQSGV